MRTRRQIREGGEGEGVGDRSRRMGRKRAKKNEENAERRVKEGKCGRENKGKVKDEGKQEPKISFDNRKKTVLTQTQSKNKYIKNPTKINKETQQTKGQEIQRGKGRRRGQKGR